MVFYQRKARDIDRRLIRHWKLNDLRVSGTTEIIDYASFNNGTANDISGGAGISYNMKDVCSFNGSSSYIVIDSYTQVSGDFTFTFWFKSPTDGGYFIDIESGRILILINAKKLKYFDGTDYYELDLTIIDNIWHFGAVTIYKEGKTQVFIDKQCSSLLDAPANKTIGGETTIGARFSETLGFFDGYIGNFRIYNKILKTSELGKLYRERR